jgi:dienelactone hydrolase
MKVLSIAALMFATTQACLSQDRTAGPSPDLFSYDRAQPLALESRSDGVRDGVESRTISFASPRGGRATGLLLVPEGPGPFAGIVLMHGMPGTARQMERQAAALARRGAVVIAIDAPWARAGNVILWDSQDSANQVQLIVDLQRAVDVLLARDDVDSARLAYVGVSYGGAMGGLFAGVERRLATYVLRVGDGGLIAHFTGAEDPPTPPGVSEAAWRAWRAAMDPIEPIRFVGRANAPIFFQNGEQDRLVPPADARAYHAAAAGNRKISWYPAGHGLDQQATLDMYDWLHQRIGLRIMAPETP